MSKAEEDLLVLARRGDLGDDDSRRLRELLAAEPDARELYEAGRALDAEALVVAGDELMYARIVRNVAARHGAARRPLRRWIARGAIAAILLAGITVGASVISRSKTAPSPARPPGPPAPAVPSPQHVAPAAPIGMPVLPPTPTPPVAPPTPQAIATPSPPIAHHIPHPPTPRVEPTPPEQVVTEQPAEVQPPPAPLPEPPPAPPPPPTAGELFAAANRARVEGDTNHAIAFAKELEVDYPKSKEAITTLVTLGMLYLKVGDAAAALSSFDAYRASGNTAVMAEALWGKSQALHALGRSADERTVLEQLVAGYPHSAYTSAAKNRLSTLK